MKKLLLAFFAFPLFTFGQQYHETFTGVSDTGSELPSGTSYGNATFASPNTSVTWTITHALNPNGANIDYIIDGDGVLLRRSNEPSSLTSSTISGGISNFELSYKKGFTSGTTRLVQIKVEDLVNSANTIIDTIKFETPSGTDATVYNFSIEDIAIEGDFKISLTSIGATGNQQLTIDDIKWTAALVEGCNITTADLTALTCNDNGSAGDTSDDFLSFSLNPAGNDLGTTYTVSVPTGTITPTTGTYGVATEFVLQNGSAGAGDVDVTITDGTESGCTINVTITDPGSCSSAVPVITATPAELTGFDHMVGTPSTSQTFTVSGLTLSEDVAVNASTGFELSTDNTTFGPSVTLTPTAGTLAATTVYVRGNSAVYGAFAGLIIASSTGADNDTVAVSGFANDYVAYTIDQINGITADGIPDSLNVLVELSGVVQCMDYRAAGYSMVIIDESNKGINVYRGGNITGYENPVGGDSITVKGKIVHFRGLLQVEATEIVYLAAGAEQTTPIATTVLDETTENYPVIIENVTLVAGQTGLEDNLWPASGNTNVRFTDGTNEFMVRSVGTPLGGTDLPNGPVNITGIASQYASSSSAPFLDGYQLLICNENAIEIVCEGTNLPNATITAFNDTTLVTTNIVGATYVWTNCDTDEVVADATLYNFTPTQAGNYKVTITNGECSATSNCAASTLSIGNATLGNTIKLYPNPVVDQLTINNFNKASVTFTVTDINGKIVTNTTELNSVATINTSSWNKGVYFVNFIGANNATHTMKVVK